MSVVASLLIRETDSKFHLKKSTLLRSKTSILKNQLSRSLILNLRINFCMLAELITRGSHSKRILSIAT